MSDRMELFNVGTRVILDDGATGTVVGFGTLTRDGSTYPVYHVELDAEFQGWVADRVSRSSAFISTIITHVDYVVRDPKKGKK